MSRIAALPRRNWPDGSEDLAEFLSDLLRTSVGTMRLRPVQAVAIAEACDCGGLFGHIRVGAGKTLISALIPRMLDAQRPLLLVPATLVPKTLRDFDQLRLHWQIPHTIRVSSYSRLGLAQHAEMLNAYRPDLIIADEGHKLKRVRESAVARRVARYMHENPSCRFVCLSGTLTKGSLRDYAHLLIWALRSGAPIPLDEDVLSEWCEILDAWAEGLNYANLRAALGPVTSQEQARRVFADRLTQTPGVVISRESFREVPLTIRIHKIPLPAQIKPIVQKLRDEWIAPDGWPLADAAFEVWRVARELGLGFCYVYDPRPPEPWFNARRDWCRFVRETLLESRSFDSEFQVAAACSEGRLDDRAWLAWREIEPTFTPNSVAIWYSSHAIEAAIAWGQDRAAGIIWTEHTAFALALSECTGWAYFGPEGLDRDKRTIESVEGREIVIASIHANREGRNLQAWSANLVVCPPNSGVYWEQLIGRSHRDGQKEPVTIDVLDTIDESQKCLENAVAEAKYVADTTGLEQKLLIADWE